jgi:Zn-dependent M16 (insulinase) family peptidase
MEVPNLSSSSVWNLDDHVSVVDQVKISVVWELRNYIEISFDVKSKSFIELSFSWLTLPFININDVPLLEDLILVLVDTNVSVFLINSSLNFENLSFLVHNLSSLVSEELPPS